MTKEEVSEMITIARQQIMLEVKAMIAKEKQERLCDYYNPTADDPGVRR